MEENKATVKKSYKRAPRRKVCVFCQEKVTEIDYKDVNRLKKFVTESGKMLPRRMSGNCAKHQRELSTAIKRARIAALLPFKGE
ncbi:MAG: 30S ribosomal protein S18 [Clostridia bacterium]|nr:30S ribosomal protein S18 [Clostridia bacterium]